MEIRRRRRAGSLRACRCASDSPGAHGRARQAAPASAPGKSSHRRDFLTAIGTRPIMDCLEAGMEPADLRRAMPAYKDRGSLVARYLLRRLPPAHRAGVVGGRTRQRRRYKRQRFRKWLALPLARPTLVDPYQRTLAGRGRQLRGMPALVSYRAGLAALIAYGPGFRRRRGTRYAACQTAVRLPNLPFPLRIIRKYFSSGLAGQALPDIRRPRRHAS